MPFIKCPECNEKNMAKLVGGHTLTSWTKTYGSKSAPISCKEAELWNDCVRKHDAKLLAEKEAKEMEEFKTRRELSLTTAEVQYLVKVISNVGDVDSSITDKLKKFLDGNNEFLVIGPAQANAN